MRRFWFLILALAVTGCASTPLAVGDAPRVASPPGASTAGSTLDPSTLNPAVTQATIHATICVAGYTKTIRPPSSYTTRLKRAQIKAYGFVDTDLTHYEEDHVVSLELGGAPSAAINLFPEAHPGSFADDKLENALNDQVCGGAISLADAQARITAAKVVHGYRPDVSASAA